MMPDVASSYDVNEKKRGEEGKKKRRMKGRDRLTK
jgi:hypothetical protein